MYAFWMVLLLSQLSIAWKIKFAHYFTWIRSPEPITPAVNVYCRQLKWLTHYSGRFVAHGSRTTAVPIYSFYPTGCAWRGLWQNRILPRCHIQWLTEVLKICALVPQQESLVLEHVGTNTNTTRKALEKLKPSEWLSWPVDFLLLLLLCFSGWAQGDTPRGKSKPWTRSHSLAFTQMTLRQIKTR